MGKIRWMQESLFRDLASTFYYLLLSFYEMIRVIRLIYPTWLPGLTLPRREVTFNEPSKLTALRIIP
mgnify:FL=1